VCKVKSPLMFTCIQVVSGTHSVHCALSDTAQTEISNDSQHKIPVGEKYQFYNVSLFTWKLIVLHKFERRPNVDKRTRNVPVERKLCERNFFYYNVRLMDLITSCSHIKPTTIWLHQVLKHSFKTFLKTLLHGSDRPLVHLQGVHRNVRDRS
jgi:hypothetical protein